MTSGTRSCGYLANLTIRIFGKVREPFCLLVGLALCLFATRGTSGSVSCVESLPADSMAGGSPTELSVNGCDQSGKESPPAVAGVDLCLVTATPLGHGFSDVQS